MVGRCIDVLTTVKNKGGDGDDTYKGTPEDEKRKKVLRWILIGLGIFGFSMIAIIIIFVASKKSLGSILEFGDNGIALEVTSVDELERQRNEYETKLSDVNEIENKLQIQLEKLQNELQNQHIVSARLNETKQNYNKKLKLIDEKNNNTPSIYSFEETDRLKEALYTNINPNKSLKGKIE